MALTQQNATQQDKTNNNKQQQVNFVDSDLNKMSELYDVLYRMGSGERDVQKEQMMIEQASSNMLQLRDGVSYLQLLDGRYRESALALFGFSPEVGRFYKEAGTRGWFSADLVRKYGFVETEEDCGPMVGAEYLFMDRIENFGRLGLDYVPAGDFVSLMTLDSRIGPGCLAGLYTGETAVVKTVSFGPEDNQVVADACVRFSGFECAESIDGSKVDELVGACAAHMGMYGMAVGIQSSDTEVEKHYARRHVPEEYDESLSGYCYLSCFRPPVRPLVASALGKSPMLRELLVMYAVAYRSEMVLHGITLATAGADNKVFHVVPAIDALPGEFVRKMCDMVRGGNGDVIVAGTRACGEIGYPTVRCGACKGSAELRQVKGAMCGCGDVGTFVSPRVRAQINASTETIVYHGSRVDSACSYGSLGTIGVYGLALHGEQRVLHYSAVHASMMFLPARAVYKIGDHVVYTYEQMLRVLVVGEVRVTLLTGDNLQVVVYVGDEIDKCRWFHKYAKVDLVSAESDAWKLVGGELAIFATEPRFRVVPGAVALSRHDKPLELDGKGVKRYKVQGRAGYVVAQLGSAVQSVQGPTEVMVGNLRVSVEQGKQVFVGPGAYAYRVCCFGGEALVSEVDNLEVPDLESEI